MSTFSDISNNPSSWYIVTDQVMGGKSELEAGFDDGVFSLKGYVTTVNNAVSYTHLTLPTSFLV